VAGLAAKTPYDLLGCLEDEILAHYPKTYLPRPDKTGRPIYIEGTGNVDVDIMFLLTDMDRLVAYHTWTYETGVYRQLVESSAAAGRPITSLTSVLDLGGASLSLAGAATRTYVQRASKIDSAYYPETMGKLFLINAPGFFSGACGRLCGRVGFARAAHAWGASELVARSERPPAALACAATAARSPRRTRVARREPHSRHARAPRSTRHCSLLGAHQGLLRRAHDPQDRDLQRIVVVDAPCVPALRWRGATAAAHQARLRPPAA
jgi:hypothetical protein